VNRSADDFPEHLRNTLIQFNSVMMSAIKTIETNASGAQDFERLGASLMAILSNTSEWGNIVIDAFNKYIGDSKVRA
jgi:hypothetical protein